MGADDSVTSWIAALKDGDDAAARALWDHCFRRLMGLARKILRATPRRAADEEDVVQSAFKSFCIRAAGGAFPRLEDRDDLWKLLLTITARKALRLARREGRKHLVDESDLLNQLVGDGPGPESVVRIAEEMERLLDALGDEKLRMTALARMEGYTNQEIAGHLGCSLSTVERRLQLIRQVWSEDNPP